MKSVIIYYSYSGNTRSVALILKDYLEKKGSVRLIELKALDESKNFFMQVLRAFIRKEATIEDAEFDFSDYDIICLGTPVWAFGPAPAMNTFLKKCFGLWNKTVVIFTTYGSGTGRKRCENIIQSGLEKKGAKLFHSFAVQQSKTKDKEFIIDILSKIL